MQSHLTKTGKAEVAEELSSEWQPGGVSGPLPLKARTPFWLLIVGRKGSRTDLVTADSTCAIG